MNIKNFYFWMVVNINSKYTAFKSINAFSNSYNLINAKYWQFSAVFLSQLLTELEISNSDGLIGNISLRSTIFNPILNCNFFIYS